MNIYPEACVCGSSANAYRFRIPGFSDFWAVECSYEKCKARGPKRDNEGEAILSWNSFCKGTQILA